MLLNTNASKTTRDMHMQQPGSFPYLLRVVSSNTDQVKIMVEILKKRGLNYIQIICGKETYGEEGRDNVIQETADAGICVEQRLRTLRRPTILCMIGFYKPEVRQRS